MNQHKFKLGDVIKPIEGKKSSNNIGIKSILSATVVQNYGDPRHVKQPLKVRILTGYARAYFSSYHPGDTIEIFADSFELLMPVEQDYDLF